jgi:hypothetical protein
MIDGGETIVKKVRDEEKVLLNVAPKETETPLVQKKAKAEKASLKEMAKVHDLPWAIAAPNPAATVGNQDIKIGNAVNANGMKSRKSRKRNPPTTITPNM